MIKIQNITNEPIQRHTILFEESEVILTLRFISTVESWFFDVEYKDHQTLGYRLATGILHMISRNQPFDFYIVDNSGNGLDPFKIDDFYNDRCSLFMLEADDMEEVRDAPVPI